MRKNELIRTKYEVEQYETAIFIGQNVQISANSYGPTKHLKQCVTNSRHSKSVTSP